MQQILSVRSPMAAILNHSRWAKATLRAFSSEKNNSPPNRSRGGIPRFYSPFLPSSKGDVVRVEGDEFWHMAKVLRLGPNDRVELFNGAGGIVEGCIQRVDRAGTDVMAFEDPKHNAPQGIQWHVFAAYGTLKGGRADWLIEKCTELGATSVTPLLTERSPTMADNRVDRLQRVVLAATKQCQRLHGMTLNPPMKFHDFLPIIIATPYHMLIQEVSVVATNWQNEWFLTQSVLINREKKKVARSKFSLLAAAGSTSLINILSSSSIAAEGVIIVGPEGDFTEKEVELITKAGATSVGLGPSRLRVETATIALLATVMLWTDVQKLDS